MLHDVQQQRPPMDTDVFRHHGIVSRKLLYLSGGLLQSQGERLQVSQFGVYALIVHQHAAARRPIVARSCCHASRGAGRGANRLVPQRTVILQVEGRFRWPMQ
jgi:hypothetical protein